MNNGFIIGFCLITIGIIIIFTSLYIDITSDGKGECTTVNDIMECTKDGGIIYFAPGTYSGDSCVTIIYEGVRND